ncbi:MAG: helix-turn-helix protein [Chitinophagaceae bacterium]|nr:helix-turn-helix protein [Chitinophagaceae bacterium]
METFIIPTEQEIKRWITEAIQESIGKIFSERDINGSIEELMNRKEAAKLLRISLVTLTDWTKRGLPHYRQRGRVYYTRTELMTYLKTTYPQKLMFSNKYLGMEKV